MKFAALKIPPVPAVVLSIISVQVGAAIAKGLFATLGAAGTASARIGFSALILFIAVRPSLFKLKAKQWRAVIPYGVALGLMNLLFYFALSRLPMGLAVALEFVGPLVLALLGSRKALDLLWVVLAAAGIALIAPWSGKGVDLVGAIFALSAGACWAFYILLSKPAGAQLPGQLAVAVGMLCAAVMVLPVGIADVDFSTLNMHILMLGV